MTCDSSACVLRVSSGSAGFYGRGAAAAVGPLRIGGGVDADVAVAKSGSRTNSGGTRSLRIHPLRAARVGRAARRVRTWSSTGYSSAWPRLPWPFSSWRWSRPGLGVQFANCRSIYATSVRIGHSMWGGSRWACVRAALGCIPGSSCSRLCTCVPAGDLYIRVSRSCPGSAHSHSAWSKRLVEHRATQYAS